MKVLLDENRLRNHLGGHEVFTVRYQGWPGLKNGELLRTAETDGFEVFLTGDQTMSYEQNLTGRQIAVVILSAIEWHIIRHNLLTIQAAIDASRTWVPTGDRVWRLQSETSIFVNPYPLVTVESSLGQWE